MPEKIRALALVFGPIAALALLLVPAAIFAKASIVPLKDQEQIVPRPSDDRDSFLVAELWARIEALEAKVEELEQRPVRLASLTAPAVVGQPYAPALARRSLREGRIKTPFGVELPIRGRASTAGLPKPLQAFLRKVQAQCEGFRVISTFRRNAVVRGSGKRSLHADNKAADYQVKNPSCALRLAKGWPGGHSVDYRAVAHYHASYAPNSREWHARFQHWKPTRYANAKKRIRYAKRYRRAA